MAPDGAARALRPLPWQERTWKRVCAASAAQQLPHALLLEGSPGTGRNHFATALARLLLCDEPAEAGNCGACRGCELCVAGTHPDFRGVEPLEEGRGIGVDLIRTAIDFLAGKASHGTRKVVVVSPAERLTTAAFNAFLKSLEEPAPGTYLLLLTARGHPIPATIRSRCQRWSLPEPDPEQARDWLHEHLGSGGAQNGRDLEQTLALAAGRPLHALALHEAGEWDDLVAFDDKLRACTAPSSSGELRPLVHQVEALASRLAPALLLDRLEHHTRRWLLRQAADALRSERGRAGFLALDEYVRLRNAQRAGSNPNADLLRHRALEAAMAALVGTGHA